MGKGSEIRRIGEWDRSAQNQPGTGTAFPS